MNVCTIYIKLYNIIQSVVKKIKAFLTDNNYNKLINNDFQFTLLIKKKSNLVDYWLLKYLV